MCFVLVVVFREALFFWWVGDNSRGEIPLVLVFFVGLLAGVCTISKEIIFFNFGGGVGACVTFVLPLAGVWQP